jgi:hypothetical protein
MQTMNKQTVQFMLSDIGVDNGYIFLISDITVEHGALPSESRLLRVLVDHGILNRDGKKHCFKRKWANTRILTNVNTDIMSTGLGQAGCKRIKTKNLKQGIQVRPGFIQGLWRPGFIQGLQTRPGFIQGIQGIQGLWRPGFIQGLHEK